MKISVVVPIYNEEKTVIPVIRKLLAIPLFTQIILVDDGSTDSTQKCIRKIVENRKLKTDSEHRRSKLEKSGPSSSLLFQTSTSIFRHPSSNQQLLFISHPVNLGKGAAIRTALKYITGDLVFIQDADLEYNPSEIQKLLEAFENFKFQISNFKLRYRVAVYGSRLLNNPFPRRGYLSTLLGNHAITLFTNLLYGTHLTDSYTCYKLIPAKILKSFKLQSNRFEVEAEITAKLARAEVRILEVPISYHPRTYAKGKKIKLRDFFLALATLLKYRL